MADVDVIARLRIHYVLIVSDEITKPRRLTFTDEAVALEAKRKAWRAGFVVELREVRTL